MKMSKLLFIKLIHTLIWLFFNAVIFYLFYAVISDRIGPWVWIGLGLFLLEGIVLLIFGMKCPLTVLAEKETHSREANFDIFLPNWLARYTKLIYSSLLVIVIIILAWRLAV